MAGGTASTHPASQSQTSYKNVSQSYSVCSRYVEACCLAGIVRSASALATTCSRSAGMMVSP